MSVYNINGDEIGTSSGLSPEAKSSLLDCFNHVALWTNENGSEYITALENALYPADYPKIIAVYDSSYVPVIGDNVNTLKSHLTVTYYEEEGASGTVISSANYSLLGNLESAVNTITAVYGTYADTFTVNALDIYNKHTWNYPSDTLLHSVIGVSSTNGDILTHSERRTLYSDHGRANAQLLYTDNSLINNGNAFMIPVPADATKVTITISSGWQVAFSVWNYTSGRTNRVWAGSNGGWVSTTSTITFTAHENLGLCLSYKLTNSGSVASQDATITVTFE